MYLFATIMEVDRGLPRIKQKQKSPKTLQSASMSPKVLKEEHKESFTLPRLVSFRLRFHPIPMPGGVQGEARGLEAEQALQLLAERTGEASSRLALTKADMSDMGF